MMGRGLAQGGAPRRKTTLDAEAAVEWAFRHERVDWAVRIFERRSEERLTRDEAAAALGLLAGLKKEGLGELYAHSPGWAGRSDGVAMLMARAELAGTRIDGSPGWYKQMSAPDPDAVLIWMAARGLYDRLNPSAWVLTSMHGEAGSRPDWGQDLPAEAVTRPALDGRGRQLMVQCFVDDGRGGLKTVEVPAPDVVVGGPEQIARARRQWSCWRDGLVEVARVLGLVRDLGVEVTPPVCAARPWESARAAGPGYRILEGEQRARFEAMARAGVTPKQLGAAFDLSRDRAKRLRRWLLQGG